MIDDGVNGFLCEPDNEADWATKIETLLRDRELRNKMGAEAKRTYQQKFTIEEHIHQVKTLLNRLQPA